MRLLLLPPTHHVVINRQPSCTQLLMFISHLNTIHQCLLYLHATRVASPEQMSGWIVLSGWDSIGRIFRCAVSKENNKPRGRIRALRVHHRSGKRKYLLLQLI